MSCTNKQILCEKLTAVFQTNYGNARHCVKSKECWDDRFLFKEINCLYEMHSSTPPTLLVLIQEFFQVCCCNSCFSYLKNLFFTKNLRHCPPYLFRVFARHSHRIPNYFTPSVNSAIALSTSFNTNRGRMKKDIPYYNKCFRSWKTCEVHDLIEVHVTILPTRFV